MARARRRSWVGSRRLLLAPLPFVLGMSGAARAEADAAAPRPFPEAQVRFEQNATDGDVEVVFDVVGGRDGLAQLSIEAPDGRSVVDFRAPSAAPLGIRSFQFESPEPRDVAGLKAAYPEGTYRLSGASAAGKSFRSEVTLSHALPAPVSILHPSADAEGVPVRDLEIRWTPVAGAAGYKLEIEQEESGLKVEATLPATAHSFSVPDGFLAAGTEYTLGVGIFTSNQNVSFVETSFTTAGVD